METRLKVSGSPHIKRPITTRKIMLDVIIALIPTFIAGIVIFGAKAFTVVAISISAAVLSECFFSVITKKEQTIDDLSALLTGFLIGLSSPATTPLWQVAVASVFAIIVVKCFFGGIGKNIVNPAITARVFMLVAFSETAVAAFPKGVDAVGSATPLADGTTSFSPNILMLLTGNIGGAIGETCKIALIIGGIYLLIKGVISWHIPVAYIAGTYIFALIIGGFGTYEALLYILSGSLLIGAIFMATDYVTSPVTPLGKCVYGVLLAFLTVVIREFSNYPEGVSFAILFMNILTPYIDMFTARKLFGGKTK